jgi:hypothetical protein
VSGERQSEVQVGPLPLTSYCSPLSQKICLPPARISLRASRKYAVDSANSRPTCSAYSSQLFLISSSKRSLRFPSRSPSCRFPGW